MYKSVLALVLLYLVNVGIVTAQIQPDSASIPVKYFPSLTKAIKLGDIKALRDIAPMKSALNIPPGKSWTKSNYFKSNELKNPLSLPQGGDPLVAISKNNNPESAGIEIAPGLNFEGLSDNSGISPPDPVGDVGLNHYVQMINSSSGSWFQIWDKQGNSVYGPALTGTIWGQVQSGSIGDPLIQYDHDAQRWLMMEMQGFSENQLLIAISDDSDPTGGWKAYRIQCQGFPDYPKLYVWPGSYFVTINEIIETNKCSGYALDRNALLAGDTEIKTYRFEMPNYQAIRYQPATGADWEGGPPPPPGSPGLIFRLYDDAWDGGNDQIQLWQIFTNWDDTTQNYALGPTSFLPPPFETRVCHGAGLFDCIEQPGYPNTPRITALENIIMYRAPYRNFGTYESIVLNHVTDISTEVGDGGDAGIRWYEFRKNTGQTNWSIFQTGTYAPDMNNRFTATISQDIQGNIAMGYTTASILTYPGIRITGRRISDTPGTMPINEYTLIPGAQSHLGDSRWGDYSNLSVDPVDGKTFWYVSEYQPSGVPWSTRIGTFQIRRDSYDISPTAIVSPVNASLLTNQQVTVKILNGGILDAGDFSASLYINGVLSATEAISGPISPNNTIEHTFQPLITWNTVGEQKEIKVITKWVKDAYAQNDTVVTKVKKLPSFDASIAGTYGLPGLICTADHSFGLILRNAAGLPLDSVQIRWNLNNGPITTIHWTGHLLPSQQDTIPFTLTGLTNPQNLLKVRTILPNGQTDQDSLNDKIQVKVSTNLQGAFLTLKARTDIGLLSYEIRDGSNGLITKGAFSPGEQSEQVCTSNSTCYKLIIKSTTFRWEGYFAVYDIFGNLLASVTEATPQTTNINFCTPSRKNVDVGAFELLSPKTGPNLSANEPVTVAVRNFGLNQQQDVTVEWREQGGNWHTETMTGSIAPGLTKSFVFASSTVDMSTPGATRVLEIRATVPGDEKPENDASMATVTHKVQRDLALLDFESLACYNPEENVIRLKVENTGLMVVDSFTLSYVLNGTPGQITVANKHIAPGETDESFVQIDNGKAGNNTITINISAVNAAGNDDYEANDEKTSSFFIDLNKIPIDITFGLDEKPTETSWELRYAGGELIGSGGGYTEKLGGVYVRYCVDKDSCLVFKLFDSAHNGMGGSVNITDDRTNTTIWSFYGVSDTFTAQIKVPFCATTLCSGFTATFIVTPSGGGSNGSIAVQPSGGTAPYKYSLNSGTQQTSNTFTGLTSGDYVISVVDANNCEFAEVVTVSAASGVVTTTEKRAVSITPNPTTGLFWLKMTALKSEQFADCAVYDASGKIVRQFQMAKYDNEMVGSCSLEKNPAGMYFVIVRQKNGMRLAEKRIQKIN